MKKEYALPLGCNCELFCSTMGDRIMSINVVVNNCEWFRDKDYPIQLEFDIFKQGFFGNWKLKAEFWTLFFSQKDLHNVSRLHFGLDKGYGEQNFADFHLIIAVLKAGSLTLKKKGHLHKSLQLVRLANEISNYYIEN